MKCNHCLLNQGEVHHFGMIATVICCQCLDKIKTLVKNALRDLQDHHLLDKVGGAQRQEKSP